MKFEPPSRLGIIIGIFLGFLIIFLNSTDTYVWSYRSQPEKLELARQYPQLPESARQADAIQRYFSRYGVPLADPSTAYLLSVSAARNGVDPYFMAALAFLESTGGKHACGYNWHGYCSCCTRFESLEQSFATVARTLSRYPSNPISAASIWRTGGLNDPSDYPHKIVKIMRQLNDTANN